MQARIRCLLKKAYGIYKHSFLILECLLLVAIAFFGVMSVSFAQAPSSEKSQKSGKSAAAIERVMKRRDLHKLRKAAGKRFRAARDQKTFTTSTDGNKKGRDDK